MKKETDAMWTDEQASIRKFSPSFYLSSYWVRKIAAKFVKGKTLDIGCGDTDIINELLGKASKRSIKYVGVDISKQAVNQAKKKNSKFSFLLGDITNLGCKSTMFDTVLALNILEHIENDKQALKEIYRVLTPGGVIIIQVPLHKDYWGALDIGAGHIRRYVPLSLMEMVQDIGFIIEERYYLGYPLLRIYKKFQQIMGRKDVKHVPKGRKLQIYLKCAPFILPLFRFDNLFSWCSKGVGVLIVARKPSEETRINRENE